MKTLNKGFQNKAMKNGFVHVKLKTILQRQKIKGGNFPNMFFFVWRDVLGFRKTLA